MTTHNESNDSYLYEVHRVSLYWYIMSGRDVNRSCQAVNFTAYFPSHGLPPFYVKFHLRGCCHYLINIIVLNLVSECRKWQTPLGERTSQPLKCYNYQL